MPRPISESDVLHHAAKELPDESVIERVRAAIGMPPKSKTFYMLTLDLAESIGGGRCLGSVSGRFVRSKDD
jgi:hypothetical protein